jgi:hypothetical protein
VSSWPRIASLVLPLWRLSSRKQPSDTVALLALPITRRSVTCASGAFRPICLVRRASNNRLADLPVRRLPTRLTDARRAVGWRYAFGAPSQWFLSSAHARTFEPFRLPGWNPGDQLQFPTPVNALNFGKVSSQLQKRRKWRTFQRF